MINHVISMRHARAGMAGYRDMNLYGTLYDGCSLKKVVGPEIETFEMFEMQQRYEKLDPAAVTDVVENRIKKWHFVSPAQEEGMRMAYSVVSPMEDDHGNGYSWCLFRPDGNMLALEEGWSGGAGYGLSPDGRASYGFHLDIDSIIPLEGLEKLVLMPYRMHYDDHDQPVYDYLKDWAIELTPILRPAQTIAEPIQTLSPEEQAALTAS